MLLQKIAERFVGQFLQRLHPILGEPVQRVQGLGIELDAPAHRTCRSLGAAISPPSSRFFAGAASAAARFAAGFAAFAFPPLSSMLRRSASMRLTTFAGRAAGFSFGAGNPACLERMSSIIAFS